MLLIREPIVLTSPWTDLRIISSHIMSVRIIAVRKNDEKLEAISHYKWINEQNNSTGISVRLAMIAWVEHGNCAYVSSYEGTVTCYVNQKGSTKFLQTGADSRSSNNLLNLPSC